MRTRVLAAALTLAVAAALTACDATGLPLAGSSRSAAPPQPCALVTGSDLEQALGESFDPDSPSPSSAGRAVCGYAASETGHRVDVTVYADATGYQDLVSGAQNANDTPVPVTGVGRAAVRTHTVLLAVFDSFVLSIAFVGIPTGDSTDTALEALGRLASDRASGGPSASSSPSDATPTDTASAATPEPSGSVPTPSPSAS